MNSNWVFKTMNKQLIGGLLLVFVNAFIPGVSSMAQDQLSAKAVNLVDISWGAAGGGNGFPVGVRTAQQGIDADTGGVTYYALFPAGSKFDLHWHTHDEFVVVAQGALTIELGEELYQLKAGAYIVIPGTVKHEWTVPEGGEDAIILVRRAGPADFHFVSTSD